LPAGMITKVPQRMMMTIMSKMMNPRLRGFSPLSSNMSIGLSGIRFLLVVMMSRCAPLREQKVLLPPPPTEK